MKTIFLPFTIGKIIGQVIPQTINTLGKIREYSTIINSQIINEDQIHQQPRYQYFEQNHENVSEEQLLNPLQLYINGQRQINNPYQTINYILEDQKILKIQRCASSLWRYFPSGIASFFTMILSNKCVRHEYVIIFSQDYVISAEISSSKDCKQLSCLFKNDYISPNQNQNYCKNCNAQLEQRTCLQVMVWTAQDNETKQKIYSQYKDRFCSRVLKQFSTEEKTIAENFSFPKLLMLWTIILQVYQIQNNLNSTKTFARASFYFLQEQLTREKIFQSILSLYSDKPGYLFDPVYGGSLLVAEKGMNQFSQNFKEVKQQMEEIFERIYSLNI